MLIPSRLWEEILVYHFREISKAAELFSNLGARYIQYKPYITDKKEELWKGLEEKISEELSSALKFSSPFHNSSFLSVMYGLY